MIIETKEATVESSMDFGDSLDMGIAEDAEGLKHLMSLLTNLYNDPELAVIREYYTNALDAHVEVGQTKPVDIYLPTRDNPLYVVKDYGVGMSREDIAKIYRMYGASTKRNTNKQVGAFGLGCKSALTIATQFTLTSVKDGFKTTALISKDESGINKVDILPVRASTELTGTTVTIPVPNVSSFSTKLLEFFKYADPDKVLLNGQRPANVYDTSSLLDMPGVAAKVYTRRTEKIDYWNTEPVTFQLVMGSVPYEITRDNLNDSLRRTGLKMDISSSGICAVFVIGIGDVDLTPSREGLRYTDKTTAFVDGLIKEYVASIVVAAQKEIDAVESRSEVFETVRTWKKIIPMSAATWRGHDIKYQIKLGAEYPHVQRYSESASHDKWNVVSTSEMLTIVTGVSPKEYRKVSQWLGSYLNETGGYSGSYLMVPDLTVTNLDDPWVTDNAKITVIQSTDLIDKAKEYRREQRAIARAEKSGPAPKQTYPVLDLTTGGLNYIPYNEIDPDLPYIDQSIYTQGSIIHDWIAYPSSNLKYTEMIRKTLAKVTGVSQVILVEKPRKADALEKRVSGSYSIEVHFQKLYVELNSRPLKQSVRDYMGLKQGYNDFSHLMNRFGEMGLHTQIPDADLRRILNPKRKDKLTYTHLIDLTHTLRKFAPASIARDAELSTDTDVIQRLVAKYPLIDNLYVRSLNSQGVEHAAIYIKAVAESEKELLSAA